MRIPLREKVEIEDLGNHPASTVIQLGLVLAGQMDGAAVTADPKRKDCYEVAHGANVYYVYVSRFSGIVSLIAAWKNVRWPNLELSVAAAVHP